MRSKTTEPSGPDTRFEAEISLESVKYRRFRTRAGAEAWLARVRAVFEEANKLADGEIWTSIELIYLTRIDCSTARLTAAMGV